LGTGGLVGIDFAIGDWFGSGHFGAGAVGEEVVVVTFGAFEGVVILDAAISSGGVGGASCACFV